MSNANPIQQQVPSNESSNLSYGGSSSEKELDQAALVAQKSSNKTALVPNSAEKKGRKRKRIETKNMNNLIETPKMEKSERKITDYIKVRYLC